MTLKEFWERYHTVFISVLLAATVFVVMVTLAPIITSPIAATPPPNVTDIAQILLSLIPIAVIGVIVGSIIYFIQSCDTA